MKKLVTLIFLFNAIISFGQKALTGSILIQNSGHHLGNDEFMNGLLITKYYNTVQIPTASFAYQHFRSSGSYIRWQLSGWRYQRITDEITGFQPSTGLIEVNRGVRIYLASGRIGFAGGLKIADIKENSRIFLEFALTSGWRSARYSPYTSIDYPRQIFTTATQLGPNIVLHRDFGKGFLRFAGLLPILQFKTEYYRIDDPTLPVAANRQTSTYVDGQGWRNAGVEIGGGFYFSEK